jgi:hypothetical protein
MFRLPSVRTLRAVFNDNARQARTILEMTRADLEKLPAGMARVDECFHSPKTHDIRLHCLDALAGTHGVEAFETPHGWYNYLNTGDTYAPALVFFRGRYQVVAWGDIAERYI